MRTTLAALALMIVLVALPASAEASASTVIRSENFVILHGGAVAEADKLTGTAGLGATTYFYFDEAQARVGLHIGQDPPPEIGQNWLAATAQRQGDALSLLLQRSVAGEVVQEEEVGLADFQPITRLLFTEPDTDRRHLIRFTPEITTAQDPTGLRALSEARIAAGPGPMLRNGELLQFLGGRSSGERLFFHIPDTGFVELAMRPWNDARPVGRLEGGVLAFSWDGDDYEIYSQRSSDDVQGDWRVWVRLTREVPDDLAPLLRDLPTDEFVIGSTTLP